MCIQQKDLYHRIKVKPLEYRIKVPCMVQGKYVETLLSGYTNFFLRNLFITPL